MHRPSSRIRPRELSRNLGRADRRAARAAAPGPRVCGEGDDDPRLYAARHRAGAVGVAQAAYEYSVGYAKTRVQFVSPSRRITGVNFMIADMATEIEAARLLVWQAAWLLDQGKRATLQSSFARRFAADIAMKVTTDAVHVFGGYGYIKEYPVEKLMREAKLFQIYEARRRSNGS